MKFIYKILAFFGIMKGNREDEQELEQEKEPGKVVPMFGSGSSSWKDSYKEASYKEPSFDEPTPDAKPEKPVTRPGDKVLSMPVNQNAVSVVVIEPIDFNDSQKMADYLCKNQPVVINFEDTDQDTRKRIIDFVSGTIYALDGTLRKIGRNLLVCAPPNVEIDTENTNYVNEEGDNPWEK